MITAPWTKEQVDALNAFQRDSRAHPFTCPNDHGQADRTLIANEGGWYCQHCDYTQDWAHAFMAQRHPLTHGSDGEQASETDASERTSDAGKGFERGGPRT